MKWFDWILGGPSLTLEERNVALELRTTETEKRAALLEKEAEIRKRLVDAEARCIKAKQVTGTKQPYSLKMMLVVVAAAGILFLVLKSCAGA